MIRADATETVLAGTAQRAWTPRYSASHSRFYFERRDPNETSWTCTDGPRDWNCSEAQRVLVAAALGIAYATEEKRDHAPPSADIDSLRSPSCSPSRSPYANGSETSAPRRSPGFSTLSHTVTPSSQRGAAPADRDTAHLRNELHVVTAERDEIARRAAVDAFVAKQKFEAVQRAFSAKIAKYDADVERAAAVREAFTMQCEHEHATAAVAEARVAAAVRADVAERAARDAIARAEVAHTDELFELRMHFQTDIESRVAAAEASRAEDKLAHEKAIAAMADEYSELERSHAQAKARARKNEHERIARQTLTQRIAATAAHHDTAVAELEDSRAQAISRKDKELRSARHSECLEANELKAARYELRSARHSERLASNHWDNELKAMRHEHGEARASSARHRRAAEHLHTHATDAEAELLAKDAAIAEKDAELFAKDAAIAEKDAELFAKDAAIAEKDAAIAEQDADIAEQDAEIEQLQEEHAVWAAATGTSDDCAADDPEVKGALDAAAEVAARGRFDTASDTLVRLLGETPTSLSARDGKSVALAAAKYLHLLGHDDESIALLHRAATFDERDGGLQLKIARMLFDERDYAGAYDSYVAAQAALVGAPGVFGAPELSKMAMCAFKMGNLGRATGLGRQALTVDGEYAPAAKLLKQLRREREYHRRSGSMAAPLSDGAPPIAQRPEDVLRSRGAASRSASSFAWKRDADPRRVMARTAQGGCSRCELMKHDVTALKEKLLKAQTAQGGCSRCEIMRDNVTALEEKLLKANMRAKAVELLLRKSRKIG